jgi:NAD(P)-dependent dehydrogenase (short-subunit alcohol dehydrogenase family)
MVLQRYGRLDVLVYNSGAIWWSSVENTPTKRFQLMQRVNPEGLYATVQAALPYFKQNGWNGRIIVVSPPIYSRFFRGKTAYAMGKVGMSVLTKGLAVDFEREGRTGMAITSIWPAVVRTLRFSLCSSEYDEQGLTSNGHIFILMHRQSDPPQPNGQRR